MHITLSIPNQQLQNKHFRNQPFDFVWLQESASTMLKEFFPQIEPFPEENHQCLFVRYAFSCIHKILTQSSKDGLEPVLP